MQAPHRAFHGANPARPAGLQFRAADASDRPYLLSLYADTRAAEMALVADWSDAQKTAFVAGQFDLQDRHYRSVYVGADFLVVEERGIPIGRIYVYRTPGEIRLMEVTLAPAARNRGIGTALLRELMAEAEATGAQLTLHIEPDNPAQRLYGRLGFTLIEHRGAYDFLGWRA